MTRRQFIAYSFKYWKIKSKNKLVALVDLYWSLLTK